MTGFTDDANGATAVLRQRILDLPFNRELAAGALSRERFQFYMLQDALYLAQYSRALSIASARAPDIEAVVAFGRAAHGAIVVERALHESVFAQYGLDPAEAAQAEPTPTCLAYTSFLLATAYNQGYEILVAALLPCFSVYWEVGNDIAQRAWPDNPYQAWIETYSDPQFGATVETVAGITDRVAASATDATRAAMLAAFKRSVLFEWMFWDSAYRLERWPVAV